MESQTVCFLLSSSRTRSQSFFLFYLWISFLLLFIYSYNHWCIWICHSDCINSNWSIILLSFSIQCNHWSRNLFHHDSHSYRCGVTYFRISSIESHYSFKSRDFRCSIPNGWVSWSTNSTDKWIRESQNCSSIHCYHFILLSSIILFSLIRSILSQSFHH